MPTKGVEAKMSVAKGIEMLSLDLPANLLGKPTTIYPTLLWDREHVILIDAGYPGQYPQIREAIVETGAPLERIDTVIVTHQDIDHIGCLGVIQKEAPQKVQLLAHEIEQPYIQGDACPVKLAKLEAQRESLPEAMQAIYEKLKAGFASCRVPIDRVLRDGEELAWCGGIKVIHTPGHTPGHICLYHQASKTLIAGDALQVENGQLLLPPEFAMDDVAMNRRSLAKLNQYEIEAVICYHGGLCRWDPQRQIAELAG